MALKFCELYLSNSVVLSLLPLPCNHGSLAQKLYTLYKFKYKIIYRMPEKIMKGDFDLKLEVYQE